MSQLGFHLLGSPWLERDGAPLQHMRRRAMALAIYLAATGRRHSRESLMAIFWPDHSTGDARADLRRMLHLLRRSLGDDWLVTESDHVELGGNGRLWLDVAEFDGLLDACTRHSHPSGDVCDECLPLLARAADLYRDDFLAGFSLPDSPEFDAWQYFEGERLRAEMASVLERLIRGHAERRNAVEAIGYAHRRLVLDPLNEESHRSLMELYAANGQQAAVLRQYEQCARLLQQELDVSPSQQTDELLSRIRTGSIAPAHFDAGATKIDDGISAVAPPALDEIRLVTVLSLGLIETSYDALEPTLDQRLADVQTLLKIVGEVAAPFDGRIQSSAGEDLLVFFGVDRVHEDDAERGVLTALTVAAEATEQGLAVQAGVNSGMAYIRHPSAGESIESAEFMAMGPVVNLAMRLRNRTAVGEVLVGAGGYRPTRGAFEYEALSIVLPGVEGPVPVYRVLRPRTHPTKVRGIDGLRANLTGRGDEVATLHAIVARVERRNHGHLAAIVAGAGVGKSRLVAELKRLVEPGAFLWLEGRSQAMTESTGYWLFTDMLRDYLGHQDADRSISIRLVDTLQGLRQAGHLSKEDVDEVGPLLVRLLSLRLEAELDLDWDNRLAGVSARQLRRRTLAGLKRLFQALAASQKLVLVCEDLHWADPLSLDLIGALMETFADTPMLVLAVYRPEEAQGEGQLISLAQRRCPDYFSELRLPALTSEQSRQLVASLLAVDALPPPMRQLITAKAQGNPLYLEEVVRTLIDGDVLYRDGSEWRARHSLSSVVVPASLQSIILSRVDRLEGSQKVYLQAAAVLGRFFRPRLVEAMGTDDVDQASTLADLSSEMLVHQERSQPEPEYSFHHVLVRDAVYQDLPRGYRTDLHRRAAQAIETLYADVLPSQVELLAHHYDLGDDAPKAVTYLVQAGRKAQAAYLNPEARDHFERALQRLADLGQALPYSEERLEALHGLGVVEMTLGNLKEAEDCLRQALKIATDQNLSPDQQVSIILSLCQLLASTQDDLGLVELCDQGLALLAGHDAPMASVAFTTYLANVSSSRGEWRQAMCHIAPIVDTLSGLPYSGQLIDAYFNAVLWCRFAKQVEWGVNLVADAIDGAQCRRDLWGLAHLHGLCRLFLQEALGDSEGALESVIQSARFADMAGNELMARNCNRWYGVIHGWVLGNLDEAERYARQDLQAREAMYQPAGYVFTYVVLGLVQYCRHRWTEALDMLERAHGLATWDEFRVDGVRRGRVGLAWTYHMLDRKAEGLALLTQIATEEELHIESWPTVACALAGLEAMCADTDEYDTLCRRIVAARREVEPLPLAQWRLQPAEPDARFEDDRAAQEPGFRQKPDLSDWTWHNQFGDCTYETGTDGITICAANYHDLWLNNFAAPRLLRPASGDFAIETSCSAAYEDRLPLGGLLLWQDRENYLRLTWNTHAPDGIVLLGCLDNVDLLFGMGRLAGAMRVHLRMERMEDRVRALCSADGVDWYSVWEMSFPAGPIDVGPLGIGMIHRYVHAGAWTEGTAIRFESLRLVL